MVNSDLSQELLKNLLQSPRQIPVWGVRMECLLLAPLGMAI